MLVFGVALFTYSACARKCVTHHLRTYSSGARRETNHVCMRIDRRWSSNAIMHANAHLHPCLSPWSNTRPRRMRPCYEQALPFYAAALTRSSKPKCCRACSPASGAICMCCVTFQRGSFAHSAVDARIRLGLLCVFPLYSPSIMIPSD